MGLKLASGGDSTSQMVDGVLVPTEIRMRLVAELLPYARNSKRHGPRQIEAIAASMREVGFTNPVLVADGGILAGHGRILAAQKVGLKRVPTIDLSHLDEVQRRSLIIWDNRSAELDASWDLEMLKLETDDLRAMGLDLEASTGWAEDELAKLFEGMEDDPTPKGSDPDDVPDVPAQPVSVPGDVWCIGDHRVMCGSALSRVTGIG